MSTSYYMKKGEMPC